MRFRVPRLEVERDTVEDRLEVFINRLEGQVLSIVPYISPTFQGMGATAKIDFLLIVEGVE